LIRAVSPPPQDRDNHRRPVATIFQACHKKHWQKMNTYAMGNSPDFPGVFGEFRRWSNALH
jgi:hypothetical protein